MKILEMIELRTAEDKTQMAEKYLSTWINQASAELNGKVSIINYRHMHLTNDFSVHLLADKGKTDCDQSSLSKQLVSSLKDFGLVNYSVWVEHSCSNTQNKL